MKYFTKTYKSTELPKDVIQDINNLLKEVIDLKKDPLWKNYKENYYLNDNLYTSVQYNEKGSLELLSGIHTKNFYPNKTYRVFNRLVRNPQSRLGAAKTNGGEQPSHVMLRQQINTVKFELNADFYFISRQSDTGRWINFYINQFNKDYNEDLFVSKERYWILDSKNYKKEEGAQILIYPKSKPIPFMQCQ